MRSRVRNLAKAFALACLLMPVGVSVALADVVLSLTTDKNVFLLGEPLTVDVELRNEDGNVEEVVKYLAPEYKFTSYMITRPDGQSVPYEPVTMLNVRGNYRIALSPGEVISATAKIFFGNKGWLFTEPGSYRIQASHTALDGGPIVSNELDIEIASPTTEAHRAAAEVMLTSEVGLFLLWNGGDQLQDARASLQQISDQFPETVYAGYADFALGMNLSVSQGERSADLEQATAYLERAERKSAEMELTDYVRSTTLLQLFDNYQELGESERLEDVRETLQREYQGQPAIQDQLESIERSFED